MPDRQRHLTLVSCTQKEPGNPPNLGSFRRKAKRVVSHPARGQMGSFRRPSSGHELASFRIFCILGGSWHHEEESHHEAEVFPA